MTKVPVALRRAQARQNCKLVCTSPAAERKYSLFSENRKCSMEGKDGPVVDKLSIGK